VTGVAFDLDGTLYIEGEVAPGAPGAVAAARANGVAVMFVTNTSGRTRREIATSLSDLGIPADPAEVITSASAAARWTVSRGVRRVWVTGASGLVDELEAVGVRVTTDHREAEAVVVGLDRAVLQSRKPLPEAMAERVRRGECILVACNRDATYPGRDGVLHPGCGEVVRLVESQCARGADVVVGKPEPYMLECAARERGVSLRDTLVVGDSWVSDVGMARRCGSRWALVAAPGHMLDPASQESAPDPLGVFLEGISGVEALLTDGGSK
jgi:glycerol-1-phosphatase